MFDSKNLHHFCILEGDKNKIREEICFFCENDLCFPVKANPDFWYEEFDRFSVADARNLREMQLRKTVSGSRKIFVVFFNFITSEAQNALLKVLEEPTEGTHIMVIVPSAHIFLETILSRARVYTHESKNGDMQMLEVKKFLEMSFKERSNYVLKLVNDIKDEKKSKIDAIYLIRGLERYFKPKIKEKKVPKILKELQKVESYLHDSGSSAKILLEYIASIV